MALQSIQVNELVYYTWDGNSGGSILIENHKYVKQLKNPEDTYLIIFGQAQYAEMEWFLKQTKWTLLYRGIKARNMNYPSCTSGRNTIFVFEYNEPKA